MLTSLAGLAYRHPRRMALCGLLVFVVAGVFGAPAAGLFKAQNAFEDPHSDSARAEQLLKRLTGREVSPGVLALVAAPPESPAVASVAAAIARQPDVAAVAAPAAGRTSPLISTDGRSRSWPRRYVAAPTATRASRRSRPCSGGATT
jgi:hypothetical protein